MASITAPDVLTGRATFASHTLDLLEFTLRQNSKCKSKCKLLSDLTFTFMEFPSNKWFQYKWKSSVHFALRTRLRPTLNITYILVDTKFAYNESIRKISLKYKSFNVCVCVCVCVSTVLLFRRPLSYVFLKWHDSKAMFYKTSHEHQALNGKWLLITVYKLI